MSCRRLFSLFGRTSLTGFCCLLCLSVFPFERLSAQQLDVAAYQFQGDQPYTEIWVRVLKSSVVWSKDNSISRASVEIIITITDRAGQLAAADKFSLQAEARDSTSDFLTVRRIPIPAGIYTMAVEAADLAGAGAPVKMEQSLEVDPPIVGPALSDPLLLAAVSRDSTGQPQSKNGLLMEPLPLGVAGPELPHLHIYTEAYGLENQPQSPFFVQYAVMEGITVRKDQKPLLSLYKKCGSQRQEGIVFTLPLQAVRSGSYTLVVSLLDKTKAVLASRSMPFVRTNPAADLAWLESYNQDVSHSFVQDIPAASMDYILKAHLPVTDQHQVATLGELIRSSRLQSQRQFIFQLWKAKAAAAPAEAYRRYMDVVRAVDNKFHTNVGYGFQSDRGHIFLKYGKPSNVLSVDTEVDASPYEIWYYNQLPQTRQTNVRFLFYNPTLAHNNYLLLHSTCIGERINPAWEVELYKSVPMDRVGPTIDATQVREGTNRNARRYFNEF